MILWLASYPKSGNTWLRIFLHTLLFSEEKTNVDINKNLIDQFPLRKHFDGLTEDCMNINEFANNCIPAQNLLNKDRKIKIYKTHNAFWKFTETNVHFTNENNTLGTIYIVRDPRNVITSVLNYFQKSNYQDALDFMVDPKKILGGSNNEFGVPTIISSWSNHYNSWKKFKKNYLLIKYENLLENPKNEFYKITDYLKFRGNFKFDENTIDEIIYNCNFDKLTKQEEDNGYIGNTQQNKKLNQKFFNLGPKNDWKNILDKEISEKLENIFENEMKDLGYL